MEHYTYIHRRRDTGAIFYVGKGRGARATSRCGRNIHWRRIVAKAGFDVEILARWSTEGECFDHERFLISTFRDMGMKLANIGSGGEGPSGTVRSQEYVESKRRQLAELYSEQPWRKQESRAHAIRHSAAIALSKNPDDAAAQKLMKEADELLCIASAARAEIDGRRAAKERPARGDRIAVGRGGREFICHQTGQRFVNQSAAARELGLDSSQISKVLRKQCSHTGGYTFAFTVL